MEPASDVSSLYGYGAFICWLCTMLSVQISWTCNRHSVGRDSIGNDFVAALMMPCIAFVQIAIELDKMRRNSFEVLPNADIVRAARYVLLWFTAFAPGFFYILLTSTGWKRKSCCGIVAGLAGLLSAATSNFENAQVEDSLIRGLCYAFLVPVCLSQIPTPSFTFQPPRRNRPTPYSGQVLLIFANGSFIGNLVANGWTATHKVEWKLGDLAPSMKYSLAELDQSVALATGIMTVVCSAYEAYRSHKLSRWERYEIWKHQCDQHIEEGYLDAVETTKWKEELCRIESRADEVIRAAESTPYLDDIRRYHDRKVAEIFRGAGIL